MKSQIVSLSLCLALFCTQISALTWRRDRDRKESEFCSGELDSLVKKAVDNSGGALTELGAPVVRAVLGPQNRVEFIEAAISQEHLGSGAPLTLEMEERAKGLGQKGDIAGQVLAAKLGGAGNQPWNVFPQSSQKAYRESWAKAEEDVAALVSKGNTVKYLVLLEYPDEAATRPDAIWWAFSYKDSQGNHCSSGTIYSPGKKIKWSFDF